MVFMGVLVRVLAHCVLWGGFTGIRAGASAIAVGRFSQWGTLLCALGSGRAYLLLLTCIFMYLWGVMCMILNLVKAVESNLTI